MREKHFLCQFSSYIFMIRGFSPKSICDPINGDDLFLWPIKNYQSRRRAVHLLGSRKENRLYNFFLLTSRIAAFLLSVVRS